MLRWLAWPTVGFATWFLLLCLVQLLLPSPLNLKLLQYENSYFPQKVLLQNASILFIPVLFFFFPEVYFILPLPLTLLIVRSSYESLDSVLCPPPSPIELKTFFLLLFLPLHMFLLLLLPDYVLLFILSLSSSLSCLRAEF